MSEFDSDSDPSVADDVSIGSNSASDDEDAVAAAYIGGRPSIGLLQQQQRPQSIKLTPKPAAIKSSSVREYTITVTKPKKCRASGKGQKCDHNIKVLLESLEQANATIANLHDKLVASVNAHRKSHDECTAALNARDRHIAAQERSLTTANKKRNEQQEKLNKFKRELAEIKTKLKKTKEELKDTTRILKKIKREKESVEGKLAKAQEDIVRLKMEVRTASSKPSKLEELEIERRRLNMKTEAQMKKEANSFKLKAEADEKKEETRRKKYLAMTSGDSGSWKDKINVKGGRGRSRSRSRSHSRSRSSSYDERRGRSSRRDRHRSSSRRFRRDRSRSRSRSEEYHHRRGHGLSYPRADHYPPYPPQSADWLPHMAHVPYTQPSAEREYYYGAGNTVEYRAIPRANSTPIPSSSHARGLRAENVHPNSPTKTVKSASMANDARPQDLTNRMELLASAALMDKEDGKSSEL